MHHLIPADDERSRIDPAHTQAIKRWVAEILHLTPDDVVSVLESGCIDQGCPLVETTIAVFPSDGPSRRWRLTRSRVAITKMAIRQTLATENLKE